MSLFEVRVLDAVIGAHAVTDNVGRNDPEPNNLVLSHGFNFAAAYLVTGCSSVCHRRARHFQLRPIALVVAGEMTAAVTGDCR
jgi:hypothetical protein